MKLVKRKIGDQWYRFDAQDGRSAGLRCNSGKWSVYFRDKDGKPMWPTEKPGIEMHIDGYGAAPAYIRKVLTLVK